MEVKIKKLHPDAVIPYKTYPSDFCYDVVAVSEEEVAPNVWKYGLGLAFQIDRTKDLFGGIVTLSQQNGLTGRFMTSYLGSAETRGMAMDVHSLGCNLSIDFRPRSSVWKTGMVLSNCEGTIDENYINEVSAIFYHVMPNMPRYKIGDRIGQIKIGITLPIDFVEVDELEERDRGLDGFGSTGK